MNSARLFLCTICLAPDLRDTVVIRAYSVASIKRQFGKTVLVYDDFDAASDSKPDFDLTDSLATFASA